MRSLALACAGCALMSSAPPPAAPQASYGPFSSQRISRHVRILASDAFEGRAPGTAGEDKTVAYLISCFKAYGLQPGGPGGQWTQALTVYRLTQSQAPIASLRLSGKVEPLLQGRDVAVNSATPSGHASVDAAPLVFVGYGLASKELDRDDFKDVDLRGKVAVALAGLPESLSPGGLSLPPQGSARAKLANLIARGAVGVLQIAPDANGAWESRVNSQSVPQYTADDQGPQLPFTGYIRESLARRIIAAAGVDLVQLKHTAEGRDFRPLALADAAISLDLRITREAKVTRNVVARIPGRVHPDETLLFTAHWDHLGRGRPDARGDDIYNGAIDNAGGVSELLELARVFAKGPRPQRSLVFLATTGEELGFWGIRHYVAHPLYPLETTVADINMDTVSMLGPTRTVQVIGWGKTTLDYEEVPSFAALQGRTLDRTVGHGGNLYLRADHIVLARDAGIPALYLSWGTDRTDARPVGDYMAERYHRPNDEWSPNIDFRGAAQNVQLLYWIARDLANSRKWPQWRPGVEFKALRDKSASARQP